MKMKAKNIGNGMSSEMAMWRKHRRNGISSLGMKAKTEIALVAQRAASAKSESGSVMA
jgi:hypothetical protein